MNPFGRQFLGLSLFMSALSFMLTSCAEEEGSTQRIKSVADVRRVPYSLRTLRMTANMVHPGNGNTRQIKDIDYSDEQAKDKITRIIDAAGSFSLVTNGKVVPVKILSNGQLQHGQTKSEQTLGCAINGNSNISGRLEDIQLTLIWDFSLSMDGDKCDAKNRENFLSFLDNELNDFNLEAVRSLLVSSEITRSDVRFINFHMEIVGEGS